LAAAGAQRLSKLRAALTRLTAERTEEEFALRNGCGDLPSSLEAARLACKRAQRRLEPALLELKYAREDGLEGQDLEAAKAAVKAATGAARDADRQLSQVHASLCARLPLFPELHRLLPDAAPRELLPIFHPQRTLKVYSNLRSLGTGAGRHAVRYAELEDGRPVVLKEYAVDAQGRRNCYKEAALLLRLRHPAVVPIEAVFCDVTDAHTTVHLQMPFYRNGTLREWWRACPPTALEAASFVQALCAAVAHLHAHSVYHCDIKPDNILVDDSARPRLADFDVSLDAASRVTETLTLRGTERYLAPELLAGGARPGAPSDVYALGVTLSEMLLNRSPHLCGLFDAMTARSAAARPSAAAALVHPCFEQLAAASAAEGGGGGRAKEERTCCLCLCDAPHVHAVGGGLECAAGRHFACDECLSQHVHHASVDDLRERARREGRVRCPMAPHGCDADSYFSDAELARHLSDDAFNEYLSSRRQLVEQRLATEAEERLRQVVQHELSNLASLDASQLRVRNARLEIAELLSLKCPGCRAPFALQSDFAECYALQCPRCPATFCAWCLGDVSAAADPHAHVIDCEQAPSDMLGHALFLRDDNGGPHVPPNPARKFERHWLFRKAVGVREVLRRLPQAVVDMLPREFVDVARIAATAEAGAALEPPPRQPTVVPHGAAAANGVDFEAPFPPWVEPAMRQEQQQQP